MNCGMLEEVVVGFFGEDVGEMLVLTSSLDSL
jgi:hypothetical protein